MPLKTQKLVCVDPIPGIAERDEMIVLDPSKTAILVGRWVPWSRLPEIMQNRDRLRELDTSDDEEGSSDPPHLQLVED